MKAAIDAKNIEGIIVYENAASSVMGVFVQQSLGEFTNSKSTVVTNVGVSDTPTASLKAEDGLMTVSGTVVKGDVFTFDVAGTSLSVVAGDGNAELVYEKGVAGQIAAATQEANISGVDVFDNGDGTVLERPLLR